MSAGECQNCGNLTVVNEAGLCPKCKDLPACTIHPEYLSSGRCLGCRLYHCTLCLRGGRCEACRAKPAPGKQKDSKPGNRSPLAAYLAGARMNPVKAGAPILVVLIAIKGLLMVLDGQDAGPPMTPEERVLARIALVSSTVNDVYQERGRYPQSAKELRAVLNQKEYHIPSLQGTDKVLIPHSVIYLPRDKGYEIKATDAESQLFKLNGKVYILTPES